MAKHPWLTQRGRVFYVRAPVPKDIAQSFGKREVTYSLKTTDRRQAQLLIVSEAKAISDRFEDHRERQAAESVANPLANRPTRQTRLLGSQITLWCDEYFQRVVDEDFATRVDLLEKVKLDPDGFHDDKYIEHPRSDWYQCFYEELSIPERLLCCVNALHKLKLRTLREALALGDCAAHEEIAAEFAASNKLDIPPGDLLRLKRKLIETEIAAIQSIIAKDTTRYDEILSRHGATASAPTPVIGPLSQVTNPGPLLETLVPAFLEEGTRSGLARKTTLSDATDIKEFISVVGNKPIRDYTPADGAKYKDTLLSLPSQRKVAPFKGLTFAQAAVIAKTLDPTNTTIQRLHVDTINDKLMAVRKFFRWADSREKGVTNPVEGLRIKPARNRGARTKPRYPFTNEELQKLFNGPIFTGCKSLRSWKVAGNFVPRHSAQFWVPLIGLFTGMRLGEIIQLRVADVKTTDGIVFFNVTTALEEDDDEGDKSTKNENSVREVPVHAMLLDIGFEDFLQARQKSGEARLFADFDRSPSDDSWSKTFSAWFTRYRRHVGVERIVSGKNRVDFHSFRHVFEDAVRDIPDVKKEWRDALQGHGEGGSSEHYGLGVRLQRLNEAMQKLAFERVDLTHLLR